MVDLAIVLNAGSSILKFSLYERLETGTCFRPASERPRARTGITGTEGQT